MSTLLDTGPLVAYLNRREHTRHPWAKRMFAQLPAPFYTCEAVLCEAAHLLKKAEASAFGHFWIVPVLMCHFLGAITEGAFPKDLCGPADGLC